MPAPRSQHPFLLGLLVVSLLGVLSGLAADLTVLGYPCACQPMCAGWFAGY